MHNKLYTIYTDELISLSKLSAYDGIVCIISNELEPYLENYISTFDTNISESKIQHLIKSYISRIQIGKLPYINKLEDLNSLHKIIPPYFNPSNSIVDNNHKICILSNNWFFELCDMMVIDHIDEFTYKLKDYPVSTEFYPSLIADHGNISLTYNNIKHKPIEIELPLEDNSHYLFSSSGISQTDGYSVIDHKNIKHLKNYINKTFCGGLYKFTN